MKNNIFTNQTLQFEKKDIVVEKYTDDVCVVGSVPVTVVVRNSNTEKIVNRKNKRLAIGSFADCEKFVIQKLAETKTQFFIRKAYFLPNENRILLDRFILN